MYNRKGIRITVLSTLTDRMEKEKCLLGDHTSTEKCNGFRKNGKTRLAIKLCKKWQCHHSHITFIGSKKGIADIKYLRGAGG
jgi:hypothetical protein